MSREWIGVDFDGTIAEYHGWNDGQFGEPIWPMIDKVRKLLAAGAEVRILTARGADPYARIRIQDWLEQRCCLPRLLVTDKKDYLMLELWDDRARRVEPNTGEFERDILLARICYLEERLQLLNK